MNKFAQVNQKLNEVFDMMSEYDMIPAREVTEPININRLVMINTKDGDRLAVVSDDEKKFVFAPVSFIKIVNELLADDEEATIENLIDEPIKIKFEKVHQKKDSKKDYIKTVIM